MARPLEGQLGPLLVIPRRIGPAGEDALRAAGPPTVLVRFRLERQFPRHEADLCVRPDAAFEISVEDAIHDLPVVDGVAFFVLAVGSGGKFNKDTKKLEAGEALTDGLKNEVFTKIGAKGQFASITTDTDNKHITAIAIFGKGKKKKDAD